MPRDRVYLLDILEAARGAMRYVAGKTRTEFMSDEQCQDAVIRRLEIVGEAARRVSDEARRQHDSVPWRDIVGFRNVLIHQYDGVDLTLVWETVQNQLPLLIETLEKIIESESA
jgi:uncharacterized protein with HEPN domain